MKKLISGLREFQSNYFCRNLDLFEQLSQGQHPRVLFITCSDSRVDPNLITQAQPGDLFVIRNAGNIIPPYGATNGGEASAVEYAIHALEIEEVVICGHSHCGAMKGLLKIESLEQEMPLVYSWLKHAEATRRLMKESYGSYEGEELLEATIAENVLTQIENLRTYPVIHSRLHQGKLRFYAWLYQIETGKVLVYDSDRHAFLPPQNQGPTNVSQDNFSRVQISETLLDCPLPQNGSSHSNNSNSSGNSNQSNNHYSNGWLSPEQAERIYRGSAAK